jgi:hypothetical protein
MDTSCDSGSSFDPEYHDDSAVKDDSSSRLVSTPPDEPESGLFVLLINKVFDTR